MCSEIIKVLLMGSNKYRAEGLPPEVTERLDVVMDRGAAFIVTEAHGACRLFQDYLASKGYRDVVVGHVRSLRYNAGGWRDFKYGDDLKERERNMIRDCDCAVVIWQDESGVIAENLEYLKKLGKPTYLYEYDSSDGTVRAGELDPRRSYRKFYPYWYRR